MRIKKKSLYTNNKTKKLGVFILKYVIYFFAFVSAALRKGGRKRPILYGMKNEHKRMTINCIGSTISQFVIVHRLPRIHYYTIDLCAFCKNPRNKMAFETYNKQDLKGSLIQVLLCRKNITFKVPSKNE